MPYGGHQQILPGKLASRMPYYHLLPGFLYPLALKLFGANASGIHTMRDIKSTGISIERFLKINRTSGFAVEKRDYYLFNPIYKYKFGIEPRKQSKIISSIPWFRNFLTMGVYFLMKPTK
jgi:hypothetical protein